MVGILSPVRYHSYEFLSNRKGGEGHFYVRILPNTENVVYPVSIIMEFKRIMYMKYVDESSDEEIKYGNEDETERELRKKSEEALAQIVEKKIPHWYKN
ncbi:DUF1703-domain-containing protein [Gigaspora margarita]|uniref:DUF1703-domain-containing protein n=1 Tax=Gigaspora margarita TaxID=4874 RepID=A0A8H4ACH5_GIGMA|nr:DUF1703-domain-containing protein [Gigaspora margarita]